MASTYIPPSDDNETDNAAVVQLLTLAHAMTDLLRSDDDIFRAFCRLVDCTEDSDRDQLREVVAAAHDMYAAMTARATRELAVTRLTDMLNGLRQS